MDDDVEPAVPCHHALEQHVDICGHDRVGAYCAGHALVLLQVLQRLLSRLVTAGVADHGDGAARGDDLGDRGALVGLPPMIRATLPARSKAGEAAMARSPSRLRLPGERG
jgi:hypothetical protein